MVYTVDIPQHPSFTDDKAILSSNDNTTTASLHLQEHLNPLQTWFHKWRIKINTQKSSHITFTLGKSSRPPVSLNKYLGF
jgi:hypothetical protein